MSAIVEREDGSLDISKSQLSALKNSIFPGATDESIEMAVRYCIARKLDVFKKPCHIVPINTKNPRTNQYEWRDVIMPGVYELRTTAFRTGEMAGIDEPIYGDEIDFFGVKAPEYCKVTVYRTINGQRCAFTNVEYFTEAAAVTGKGDQARLNAMWTKRPRGQLAKCAEAGALRKAFPDEMGGIITSDEADGMNIEPIREVDITPNPELIEKISEIKMLVNATKSDESKFLNYLGIKSYDDITVEVANKAIAALNHKVEKAQTVIEPAQTNEPEVIDI